MNKYFLGLDIGASSLKFGWGDCQHGLQFIAKKELTQKSLSCLKETVQDILLETDREIGLDNLQGIGIGTPGTIDSVSGKIVGVNPNLPFWVDLSPRILIPDGLSLPVSYDNDANLMCLAEAWLRGSRGKVVGITVGSGIGSGFVEDGRIYHGAHGLAMEMGHVTSVPGGELCTCGRKGCLEAYASVDGIRRRILKVEHLAARVGNNPALSELLQLRAEFPEINGVIEEGLQALALELSNLSVVLDPDLLVIGGGAMDAGMYELGELEDLLKIYLPLINRSHLRLEKAKEGNRAGVLGAIILASQCE